MDKETERSHTAVRENAEVKIPRESIVVDPEE